MLLSLLEISVTVKNVRRRIFNEFAFINMRIEIFNNLVIKIIVNVRRKNFGIVPQKQ